MPTFADPMHWATMRTHKMSHSILIFLWHEDKPHGLDLCTLSLPGCHLSGPSLEGRELQPRLLLCLWQEQIGSPAETSAATFFSLLCTL